MALAAAPAPVHAASFDCQARRMSQAEAAICSDIRLSRMDDELSRRFSRASRQLAYGPYVGLRVWRAGWRQQRTECSADRTCLQAAYREAYRFLDRLQNCLGTSYRGRHCLHAIDGERSAVRRP